VTKTETVEPETVEVPDVVGEDHVTAGAEVDDAGLVANTYPVPSEEARGTVLAQTPGPGSQLPEGTAVRLNVALGPGARGTFGVPDVTGMAAAEARDRCRRARFTCRTIERDAPSEEEVGEVLDQQPAAQLSQMTLFVGR
jgi:beta-lactam-binding protein with PASTA domain